MWVSVKHFLLDWIWDCAFGLCHVVKREWDSWSSSLSWLTMATFVISYHLMWRTDSLEKTLVLGKTEGRRRRGQQKMRWLDGITDLMDMSLSKLQELMMPSVLQSMGLQRVGHDWVTELKLTLKPLLWLCVLWISLMVTTQGHHGVTTRVAASL